MEDGNPLVETESYKLYQLKDGQYRIVTMTEDELGTYSNLGSIEKLRTIKGKLYLNGIETGSYKLVSNNNREIDFDIYEDSVSTNIRINNSLPSAKVVSSSVATLILTFGTGIARTPWMLILLVLIIVLLLLYILRDKKKKESN